MRSWYERFPDIYNYEHAFWVGKGFDQGTVRVGQEISFTGTVPVTAKIEGVLQSRSFDVRVIYPLGYPYVPPRVEFTNPRIKRARHQGVDGSPCLFPGAAWTLNFPASEFYAAVEHWLACHLQGRFPRELALYELPEYLAYSSFSILAADRLLEVIDGESFGRFSVDELLGHNLGIVWSINEQLIGRELLDAIAPGKARQSARHNGRWFRLPEEPPPIQNTVELQNLLAGSGHNVDLAKRPKIVRDLIGVVFPDEALKEERLLFLDIGVRSKKVQPDVGKGWRVRAPRTYVVSNQELFRRLNGVHDLELLGAKRITCFGLGAIGAPLALALTREGVGELMLCDPDVVRPGNVIRHALDLLSVGQFKAEATEVAAARINPYVETNTEIQNLTDPEVLATLTRNADLVILAIGDDLSEELINEVVISGEALPPMLLVRTLHGGDAFRVVLIRPGADACLQCLDDYSTEQHPDWIRVPPSDLPDVHDTGCAAPSRPGSGLTSQHAALFAAARAVELLEGRPIEVNHWFWIERPIPGADPRLNKATTLYQSRFERRQNCVVCGV